MKSNTKDDDPTQDASGAAQRSPSADARRFTVRPSGRQLPDTLTTKTAIKWQVSVSTHKAERVCVKATTMRGEFE